MANAANIPAFVRNLNDENNRIIRVDETPSDYISIHGVEYLEEREEDEDDNTWQQLHETFLEKDTETTFRWTGFSSVSCQGTSGGFPEAVAYRIDGDATEYTKDEMLALINSWDASFSGYTYWDGHNWSFQHTADEQGEWQAVDMELTEVASREHWGRTSTLYVGTVQRERVMETVNFTTEAYTETDYYEGVSGPGGESLTLLDLNELGTDADWKVPVRELLYEAISTHLAAERAGREVEEEETRNLFAERLTLAESIDLLVATGEETSEEELRGAFAQHGTLL